MEAKSELFEGGELVLVCLGRQPDKNIIIILCFYALFLHHTLRLFGDVWRELRRCYDAVSN